MDADNFAPSRLRVSLFPRERQTDYHACPSIFRRKIVAKLVAKIVAIIVWTVIHFLGNFLKLINYFIIVHL